MNHLVAQCDISNISKVEKQANPGNDLHPQQQQQQDEEEAQILFVGAGPHALTCILRLLDPEPMTSKWVDPNFQKHPSVVSQHKVQAALKKRRSNKERERREQMLRKIRVLDAGSSHMCAEGRGTWMQRWREHFNNLHIPYLRSPLDVHPDPVDPQTLRFEANHRRMPVVPTAVADAAAAAAVKAGAAGPKHRLVQVCFLFIILLCSQQ